jgi:hypothetical protein
MSDTIEKVKCLIIGSGPAGYTAAIYASRANMFPVLYQGEQPGGQLTTTNDVENFPGYPDGVTGPEMMIELQKQAERFGTDVRHGWITKVDFSGDVHKVWVNDEKEIHASTIIISTGASAKYLGLPSEQKYLKRIASNLFSIPITTYDDFIKDKDKVKETIKTSKLNMFLIPWSRIGHHLETFNVKLRNFLPKTKNILLYYPPCLYIKNLFIQHPTMTYLFFNFP